MKRALSSEDLKKVSRVIYLTFQLFCKSLGLLGGDKELGEAFYEVVVSATSQQLRQLFVSIFFCEIVDLKVFFLKCWRSVHDDIMYHLRSTYNMPNLWLLDVELQNYVLYELELLFNTASTSLEKHNLLMLYGCLLSKVRNMLLREELNYDIVELTYLHSSAEKMFINMLLDMVLMERRCWFLFMVIEGQGKPFYDMQ